MAEVDVAALRALAEAASPGPWRTVLSPAYDDDLVKIEVQAADHEPWESVLQASGTEETFVTAADGAFLAAVDPTAVLALLDRLAAAERRAEHAEREVKYLAEG